MGGWGGFSCSLGTSAPRDRKKDNQTWVRWKAQKEARVLDEEGSCGLCLGRGHSCLAAEYSSLLRDRLPRASEHCTGGARFSLSSICFVCQQPREEAY